MLLTSEPIDSEQSAQLVMDKYEKRWQVEEYHKAWKSGTKVEELRQQRGENLKKMAVLLGFIAVRLLHLKMQMETAPEQPCSEVLSKDQWQVL